MTNAYIYPRVKSQPSEECLSLIKDTAERGASSRGFVLSKYAADAIT